LELISASKKKESAELIDLIKWFLKDSTIRSFRPDFISDLYASEKRERNKKISQLVSLMKTVIKEYHLSGDEDCLLHKLYSAVDENGTKLSDIEIQHQVTTFFLAGHESVSTFLTWTTYSLANNPAAVARIKREILEVCGQDKLPNSDVFPPITVQQIEKMDFLEMVCKEALRLYPPSSFLVRINMQEMIISGKTVPAGSLILLPTYAVHHDPRNYDHPNEFKPERWTPDFFKANSHNYIPFGAGRRVCVGQKFAQQEAKIALATVFREFNVELQSTPKVEPTLLIILRPKNGVAVKLT